MRMEFRLSSAGEQVRATAARRTERPENPLGKFRWLTPALLVAAALGVAALPGMADAGSLTQPGVTVGVPLGAPLPEGVYFADTTSDGGFRGVDDKKSDLFGTFPILVWSTPWHLFGGRVWGYVATPYISFGVPGTSGPVAGRDYMALNNPFAGAGLAWDLGAGWGFSYITGAHAPVDNELRLFGHNIWAYNNRAALSYTGDGWDLTAHMIYGITSNNLDGGGKKIPDWFAYDLTAVKTLGKWQAGAVAFGSNDLESIAYGSAQCGGVTSTLTKCEQAQFAAGGLIGYQFTGITAQLFATTDVWTQDYLNKDGSMSHEKRVWARVAIPLWTPSMEEAPLK
jgi:hypothetical protein